VNQARRESPILAPHPSTGPAFHAHPLLAGRTNWLQGLLLVAAYFAIGASFLLHQQPADQP
jgi:hypothetical protein